MAIYLMGDIHGEYDLFMELLEKIQLKEEDTLYVLGDILDRGPHPIKVLLKLMEMPNVIPVVGNHEIMAIQCLEFLCGEITEESVADLDAEMIDNLLCWQLNGGQSTIDEFHKLDRDTQKDVIDFIKEFLIYEELTVNGTNYLLVHAGLGGYSPEKNIDDYSLEELVWNRTDYEMQYSDDIYVVTGHTPTQLINNNPKPGYIYRKYNHIGVDCGACFAGGRLAAICLETGKEYYSHPNNK